MQPDNSLLAAGLVSGFLAIRHREDTQGDEMKRLDNMLKPTKAPRTGSYRHFMRGQTHKPVATDFVVQVSKKPKLRAYDRLLKNFKYHEALDAVFAV
jgi:U3 small nucleolar RNA-associated protein 15